MTRRAVMYLDAEELHELLGLSDGVLIFHVNVDHLRQQIVVHLTGPDLPYAVPGCESWAVTYDEVAAVSGA